MSFNIICTDAFTKELKSLVKEHPSFSHDFKLLLDKLEENPDTGTPLGNQFFKTKLSFRSMGRQSREKPNVQVYFCIRQNNVYLIATQNRHVSSDFPEKDMQLVLKSIK
ncbi:hypothetical protein [Cognataquiflexum rubidum]|jgi:hypothetical protein|uniref:hypothetical protein n=1 Tax=Cognataquiflexum rubidum TaxID=2922273 RepID=UPI001F132373|nr:hypothetical protein [Cognataquiflexum rubidum]MCH6232983.1 hypothetical protein [Cognataquiflexum rubidum]